MRDYNKDYIFFLEKSLSRENSFLHYIWHHQPEDALKISNQQFKVADLERRLAQAKLSEVH
jgi:hypothetical protein